MRRLKPSRKVRGRENIRPLHLAGDAIGSTSRYCARTLFRFQHANTPDHLYLRKRWTRPNLENCAMNRVRGRLRGEERSPGCKFRQVAFS